MRMVMAFDLTDEDVGRTVWWNPQDLTDPAGDDHLEEFVVGLSTLAPCGEFPAGGVILSEDQRVIPGNAMVGISEETSG